MVDCRTLRPESFQRLMFPVGQQVVFCPEGAILDSIAFAMLAPYGKREPGSEPRSGLVVFPSTNLQMVVVAYI